MSTADTYKPMQNTFYAKKERDSGDVFASEYRYYDLEELEGLEDLDALDKEFFNALDDLALDTPLEEIRFTQTEHQEFHILDESFASYSKPWASRWNEELEYVEDEDNLFDFMHKDNSQEEFDRNSLQYSPKESFEKLEFDEPKRSYLFPLLITFTLLSGLVFGFLYWFQLQPVRKAQLETLMGVNLSNLDTLARTVGEKTDSFIEDISFISKEDFDNLILRIQTSGQRKRQAREQELAEQALLDQEILALHTETRSETQDIQSEEALEISAGDKSEIQFLEQSSVSEAFHIEAPIYAPVLNLVTDMDPAERRRIEAEERTRALAEIEKIFFSPTVPNMMDDTKDREEKPVNTFLAENVHVRVYSQEELLKQLTKGAQSTAIATIGKDIGAEIRKNISENEKKELESRHSLQVEQEKTDEETASNSYRGTLAVNPLISTSSAETEADLVNFDIERSDKVISPLLMQNIASYLVTHYDPKQREKRILTSFFEMNAYYGFSLPAFPKYTSTEYMREYILNYAYTPDMLNFLYTLYADAFVAELKKTGKNAGFTKEEQEQMLKDYASYLSLLGQSFQTIAKKENLSKLFEENREALEKEREAKAFFAEIQNKYEQRRYENEENEVQEKYENLEIEDLKQEMFLASQKSEQARQDLEIKQEEILSEIKKDTNNLLPDRSLLALFEWIGRREKQGKIQALEASRRLGVICLQLSRKLERENVL